MFAPPAFLFRPSALLWSTARIAALAFFLFAVPQEENKKIQSGDPRRTPKAPRHSD
jgi:hypothetical protein